MNNIIKKFGKISSIITGIGITFVGLVILLISIFAFANYREYEGKVTGKISNIMKERVENVVNYDDDINVEEYNYTVFVDYEVDGKEYQNIEYGSYSSSMEVGQEVEIQYDINDPSKIQAPHGTIFIIAFIILGTLTTLFGIYQTIKGFKITKENPMYNVMKD